MELVLSFWDGSVGIATCRMLRVWFLAGARDFSLLHSVQTGSVAHPASYPVGIWGYFPGGKATGTILPTFRRTHAASIFKVNHEVEAAYASEMLAASPTAAQCNNPSPTCERCLEKDESATHILCDCEAIAYLRFRHLGHYFMEPCDYQDAPVSRILHVIWSVGLLEGWNRGGCTIDLERSRCKSWSRAYPLCIHSFIHSFIHSTTQEQN
jgi:hypothetical protein